MIQHTENSKNSTEHLIENGQRTQIDFFSKDIHMANKHKKRCSASQIRREVQMKTTMRYHFIPFRMVAIKKKSIGEDMGSNWVPCTLKAGMYDGVPAM